MAGYREKLSGIFAPVTTPFKNQEIDENALRKNLGRLSKTPITGYLALGSTGEARSLSEEEELTILEIFREEAGQKIVMVGTATESTRHTIRKSQRAAEMGFPFVSVLTPGYFSKLMDAEKLVDYFRAVADQSPIPVVLYNAPQFAGGVSLTVPSMLGLAEHNNIAGIKDSSSVGPGPLLSRLDPSIDFAVLCGSTGFFYLSLLLGGRGGVISTANYLPELCHNLFEHFKSKAHNEALELHHKLTRINNGVSIYGPAGVKAAMDLLGYRGYEPRSPLKALGEDERRKLRILIEDEGIELSREG